MKSYLPQCTLSLLFCFLLSLPAHADCLYSNLYVKSSATGTGDGSSWTNAFTDLQAAIDAAAVGDVICVAAGTYLPTFRHNGDSLKYSTFYINKDITLLGGFSGEPGTEGTLEGRDPQSHVTILSGDLGIPLDTIDNAFHVVYMDHVSDTMRLDGFTISDGNGFGGGGLDNTGAGLFINAEAGRSNPSILNCIIRDNDASESGGGMILYAPAAGICVGTITNTQFVNNKASGGGGLNLYTDAGGNTSPTIINCQFKGNVARTADGAAVSAVGHSSTSAPTLINCVFTGNYAPSGSAYQAFGGGSCNLHPQFINCTFSGNSQAAVRVVDLGDHNSVLTIRNSIFYGNGTGNGITTSGATEDVRFSIIQFGNGGDGNIGLDPEFVSPPPVLAEPHTLGDVHLLNDSPGIDIGDNTAMPAGVVNDLDGKDRFINPNTGLAGNIDIGPYEVQSFPVGTAVAPFAKQWNCYPNPARDHITISLPEHDGQYEYVLWNSLGSVVQRQIVMEGQLTTNLQISNLPSGSYFLSLSKDGYTDTRVFTIQ